MEYDKGKISARGREISWLNHPCYLGYKGEVGYKHMFNGIADTSHYAIISGTTPTGRV